MKGTVNGVPTATANFWGKPLGVIKLALNDANGSWMVDRHSSAAEARSIQNADNGYVESNVSRSLQRLSLQGPYFFRCVNRRREHAGEPRFCHRVTIESPSVDDRPAPKVPLFMHRNGL